MIRLLIINQMNREIKGGRNPVRSNSGSVGTRKERTAVSEEMGRQREEDP